MRPAVSDLRIESETADGTIEVSVWDEESDPGALLIFLIAMLFDDDIVRLNAGGELLKPS